MHKKHNLQPAVAFREFGESGMKKRAGFLHVSSLSKPEAALPGASSARSKNAIRVIMKGNTTQAGQGAGPVFRSSARPSIYALPKKPAGPLDTLQSPGFRALPEPCPFHQ